MSRNDLSRRALIAGAASLPVAAGAITVPAIAAASGNPDAELLALGVQLDAVNPHVGGLHHQYVRI